MRLISKHYKIVNGTKLDFIFYGMMLLMELSALYKTLVDQKSLSFLDRLPEGKRKTLALYSKILSETVNSWEEKIPTVVFLKKILKEHNLTLDDEVFTFVKPDDAFELWSSDLRFLGSSLEFYTLSSFSLEELLTKEWHDLFSRDHKFTEQMLAAATSVLSGQYPLLRTPVDDHCVSERKDSPVTVLVNTRLMAPIYSLDSESIVGLIAVLKFKQISH